MGIGLLRGSGEIALLPHLADGTASSHDLITPTPQIPDRRRPDVDEAVLAARLGMAPEVLSRSFSALLPYKLKVSGSTIEIRDADALTKLAQPTPTIDDPCS